MPRSLKLTWQQGSEKRAGRWRKKYKGKVYHFPGGRGKTDREAYDAALAAWEKLKLQIDADAPKPHQEDYEQAINEWESVLEWCRTHDPEDRMAEVAMAKLQSLRQGLASRHPPPVSPADTLDGHFDLSARFRGMDTPPGSNEKREFSEPSCKREQHTRVVLEWDATEKRNRVIVIPGKNVFGLEPLEVAGEIWRDRLAVEERSAIPADQTAKSWLDRFLDEKRTAVAAAQLTPGRVYTLQLHISHFVAWLGPNTPVADISSETISNYRLELLRQVQESKWSSTTAGDRLCSVKSFIRWLWSVEAIPALPRILDMKSSTLGIGKATPAIVVFTKQEISALLRQASQRTKLYILLMLNCGMTQKDISDLDISEVDWDVGRITRKRSKTRKFGNVPTVDYLLWPETHRLLCVERNPRSTGLALLNKVGGQLLFEEVSSDGKLKKNDNINSAFDRLQKKTKIRKPLKSLKKTSATLLRDNRMYSSLEDLFLGHAPQKMSDKHYAQTPQTLLDEAITWLGRELEICEVGGNIASARTL